MPNLHPLIVHFPIALLMTSVALDWTHHLWPRFNLERGALITHLLGWVASLFTVATGLLAARSLSVEGPAVSALASHRALGLAVVVVFGLLGVCRLRNPNPSPRLRIVHFLVQIAGLALVAASGYMGGELVFTYGLGVAAP